MSFFVFLSPNLIDLLKPKYFTISSCCIPDRKKNVQGKLALLYTDHKCNL
ncbi:hypothetical protein BDA96_04G147400 [Sorghum bicolor]|uniref:Uncharacterized protein n=1 Tax=Sorghum bicolor TaxID=4558 RepID=A0A921R2U9_SORBI|nr:hypothetical protein BDA96_04G147400 [Sorghum bicolor]